jgi:type VI protein secretion system component VasK
MRWKEAAAFIARMLSYAVLLVYVGVAGWLLWRMAPLLFSKAVVSPAILQDAQAAATLISVFVTGFFGFGGIMLTNALSASAARAQAKDDERRALEQRDDIAQAARDLQTQLAQGLNRRIQDFSDAFAKYHAETLKALREPRSPPDTK